MTDHRLEPTPQTVHWGFFDATLTPAATIRSGDRITIRTVSGGRECLPAEGSGLAVLPEHRAILDTMTPVMPGHLLTGPVAIEGAAPGDVLEVRIEDVRLMAYWMILTISPLLLGASLSLTSYGFVSAVMEQGERARSEEHTSELQ